MMLGGVGAVGSVGDLKEVNKLDADDLRLIVGLAVSAMMDR
jgi:hypothetical protein